MMYLYTANPAAEFYIMNSCCGWTLFISYFSVCSISV